MPGGWRPSATTSRRSWLSAIGSNASRSWSCPPATRGVLSRTGRSSRATPRGRSAWHSPGSSGRPGPSRRSTRREACGPTAGSWPASPGSPRLTSGSPGSSRHRAAWEEANRHYLLARDHDGLPLRCPSRFLDVYCEVAARHRGAILIDGPEVLRASARAGILDDHVFNDGQHPALVGYIALAQAILDQLFARRSFGWPRDADRLAIDPVACTEHFRMGAAAWADVCARASWFLGGMAYIRHDPTERRPRRNGSRKPPPRLPPARPPRPRVSQASASSPSADRT